MFFRRKKRILKNLETSFGHPKTEGFNLALVKRYFSNKEHEEAFQVLSDQTCDDLDFDLFFSYVDRTSSKIGQQFLYDQLRTIDPLKQGQQEEVIAFLNKAPKKRLNIQYKLSQLNSQSSYYLVDLFQKDMGQQSKLYFLLPLLTITMITSLIVSFIYTKFILIVLGLIPINVVIHYAQKRKTNLFINAIPPLLALGSIAKYLSKIDDLKKLDPNIDSALTTIGKIRKKMSWFKLEQKVDGDIEAAFWFLLELTKITFLLEPLLYFSSLRTLRNKTKEIEQAFCFVGSVDAMISIVSLRHGLGEYCIPNVSNDTKQIQFKSLKHPLVVDCIENDVDLEKSMLLTGSNMSGKTTYIRAIGLNFISGITLNTCFASSADLPIAKLFSVIRIEDDLTSASSYFFKEVDSMKKVLEQAKDSAHSIVLLDEIFKGTNTIERIASAKAILTYLAMQNCQVFVSTHDIELTEMLKEEYELFHFSEVVTDATISFDYKIKNGVPDKGNAIKILDINGFPQEVIIEASNLASEKSRTK